MHLRWSEGRTGVSFAAILLVYEAITLAAGESTNPRGRLKRRITSEITLGTLIAVLSTMTALASYQSSVQGSNENNANVEGQAILADSNAEYLRANQEILYDYSMYDGFFIHDGEDEFPSEYYRANFSGPLDRAMELDPDNPFSDAYYEEMLADANETYGQALQRFEDAQASGKKSNDLQLVMLIMAVGLSFAAWASLLSPVSVMRVLFASFSGVTLAHRALHLRGRALRVRIPVVGLARYALRRDSDDCMVHV